MSPVSMRLEEARGRNSQGYGPLLMLILHGQVRGVPSPASASGRTGPHTPHRRQPATGLGKGCSPHLYRPTVSLPAFSVRFHSTKSQSSRLLVSGLNPSGGQWDPREKVTHIHKCRYSRAAGTSRDQASRPHRQKHIVQAPRSRQRWVFTCAGTGGQSKTWGRQEPCTTCFLPLQKKGPGRAAQVASRAGGSQPRRVAAPCPESGHCTMLAPGSRWPQLGCSLTGLNSSLRSQPNKN